MKTFGNIFDEQFSVMEDGVYPDTDTDLAGLGMHVSKFNEHGEEEWIDDGVGLRQPVSVG